MFYQKYPKFHILDIVKSKFHNSQGQIQYIETDHNNRNFIYYYYTENADTNKILVSAREEDLILIQSYPEQKFPIGADVIIENFDYYKGLNGKILNYNEIYQEYQISVIGEDVELILQEKDLRFPTEEEMKQIYLCGMTWISEI